MKAADASSQIMHSDTNGEGMITTKLKINHLSINLSYCGNKYVDVVLRCSVKVNEYAGHFSLLNSSVTNKKGQ